ncbi:hypothetical protein GCM10009747_21210 [Agromyces humatus]|uniref:Uncharacterized protein n=1 Tax=Agromyces humatus TaxID=279573 RepID=A0ABN2KRA1_9MICO
MTGLSRVTGELQEGAMSTAASFTTIEYPDSAGYPDGAGVLSQGTKGQLDEATAGGGRTL